MRDKRLQLRSAGEGVALDDVEDVQYAAAVVDQLFGDMELEFVWSHDRCTQRFDYETGQRTWIKNFPKAKRRGFPLERTLAIDDSPAKLQRHCGDLVPVISWAGDLEDTELR